jgi:histidinol-phosphate aminotransferase
LSLPPKPEIEKLKVCPHGGINYAELKAMGLTPEAVLDFSVCSNPFMPPPGVRKTLDTTAIEQYPDSETTDLRHKLAPKLGVTAGNIMAANGSVELIRLIALTYFGQEDSVLILEPTFGEYEVACQIVGAEVVKQRGKAEDNFAPRLEETTDLIKQRRPRGIFICNPNNPTGKYLSRQQIEGILEANSDGLLILDEVYIAFVEKSWPSIDLISQGNVVILRSMTKDYALAGLRLGYALAGPEIIDNLRRVRPPWNVNILAQKAGAIALEDIVYLERSKRKVREAKQFLTNELCRLDFQLLPSDAHFFLMRVGNAKKFRTALLKHGILVRDCASFGLPEYIRIAPRTMPDCRKLIAAIKTVKLEEG